MLDIDAEADVDTDVVTVTAPVSTTVFMNADNYSHGRWDSSDKIIGASGAVAAVVGAYLVLFPQSLVTILYWFFFIGTIELPALYFIAIKLILIDNVMIRYTPNIAYDAHLAGYAFGILALLGMLAAGLVGGSSFDLWSMIRQWNRRRSCVLWWDGRKWNLRVRW